MFHLSKEIFILVIVPIIVGVVIKPFAYCLDKHNDNQKSCQLAQEKANPIVSRIGFCAPFILDNINLVQLHINKLV